MASIEGNWDWGEETAGHTLRAGQRTHDFGRNRHYVGEAVRNDTLANINALGDIARYNHRLRITKRIGIS